VYSEDRPFFIASYPEYKEIIIFTETEGTHTISIRSQSTVDYTIIAPKYLPEPVGRVYYGGGEVFNNAIGATGWASHAEGDNTYANGHGAHAEG
jgi:hypothetical protein